ncbi:hypothetical protein AncyloWKF20_12930 [Ancylobacter sp. WKF20]|uniref:hypothetical protein n=1 Tax=Ancylobacter sp. WKF20 TaxID=3039801 RepID=UPI0024340C72|nr:hypothetical protein [Ancylobacter sp. WKF20]WGD28707.1 hypothetical protein AncyloWKF20_12930 [Ancylobacter sp. WKF20]
MSNLTDEEQIEINASKEVLNAALLHDEELIIILRSHLYIENELNKIIYLFMGHLNILDIINLNYSKKIDLAIRFGLNKDYRKRLITLGRLRNKFAHNIKASLEEKDAIDFIKSIGQDKSDMINSYHVAKKNSGNESNFDDEPPSQKIIMCILHTWAPVAVAAIKAQRDMSETRY